MLAHQVVQQTVVMGILGSTQQWEFELHLEELGLEEQARAATEREAAIAAVRANGYHDVLSKQLEKLQGKGGLAEALRAAAPGDT